MSWTFSRAELEAARDRAAQRVCDRPGQLYCQALGRAHRWLDEEPEARAAFHEGAVTLREKLSGRSRGRSADRWSECGSLFYNAGERDAAREWFERALSELRDERSVRAAVVRYRLGLEPGETPSTPRWGQTLRALYAGAQLDHVRAIVVRALVAERRLPTTTTTHMTLWDLLEETYRVEAGRDGTAPPDHAAILERTGLLGERARHLRAV